MVSNIPNFWYHDHQCFISPPPPEGNPAAPTSAVATAPCSSRSHIKIPGVGLKPMKSHEKGDFIMKESDLTMKKIVIKKHQKYDLTMKKIARLYSEKIRLLKLNHRKKLDLAWFKHEEIVIFCHEMLISKIVLTTRNGDIMRVYVTTSSYLIQYLEVFRKTHTCHDQKLHGSNFWGPP